MAISQSPHLLGAASTQRHVPISFRGLFMIQPSNTTLLTRANDAIVRKQAHRRVLLPVLIKHGQTLSPRRFLLIVDFSQIQHGPLSRLSRCKSTVLHYAEVPMQLPIFFPLCASQKHPICTMPETDRVRKEGRSSPQRPPHTATLKALGLSFATAPKKLKMRSNCESQASSRVGCR